MISLRYLASKGIKFPDVLSSGCRLERAMFWGIMFKDMRDNNILHCDLDKGFSPEQLRLAIRWRGGLGVGRSSSSSYRDFFDGLSFDCKGLDR